MDVMPNFSSYSRTELLDVLEHLDKDAYPERYEEVMSLLNDPEQVAQHVEQVQKHIKVTRYSTFWRRFWAACIDGFFFVIVLYIECKLLGVEFDSQDRFLQALNGVQLAIYAILMHGFFGQTLGKMAMGVKILNHDTETRITLKQALRRESVNLFLNVTWVLFILAIAISIGLSGAVSTGFTVAIVGFSLLTALWGLSEFVTMLFNEKRRALHDFIGRTVVVRVD